MNEGLDNLIEIEKLKDTIVEYEELSNKVKQLEDKIIKVEEMLDNCISYVLKQQNEHFNYEIADNLQKLKERGTF